MALMSVLRVPEKRFFAVSLVDAAITEDILQLQQDEEDKEKVEK